MKETLAQPPGQWVGFGGEHWPQTSRTLRNPPGGAVAAQSPVVWWGWWPPPPCVCGSLTAQCLTSAVVSCKCLLTSILEQCRAGGWPVVTVGHLGLGAVPEDLRGRSWHLAGSVLQGQLSRVSVTHSSPLRAALAWPACTAWTVPWSPCACGPVPAGLGRSLCSEPALCLTLVTFLGLLQGAEQRTRSRPEAAYLPGGLEWFYCVCSCTLVCCSGLWWPWPSGQGAPFLSQRALCWTPPQEHRTRSLLSPLFG